jgi:hypothetical protein
MTILPVTMPPARRRDVGHRVRASRTRRHPRNTAFRQRIGNAGSPPRLARIAGSGNVPYTNKRTSFQLA